MAPGNAAQRWFPYLGARKRTPADEGQGFQLRVVDVNEVIFFSQVAEVFEAIRCESVDPDVTSGINAS